MKLQCSLGCYQKVEDLVKAGEIHQVGANYYLKVRQSPFMPKFQSLLIDHDITLEQPMEMHLPTEEDVYDR